MIGDDKVTSLKQCETSIYKYLSDPVRTEYRKVCQLLIDRGVLKKDDLPSVAIYAQAVITGLEAQERLDTDGPVEYEIDRYGHERCKSSPYVKIKKEADRTVSTYALILGLAPLGRKRLKAAAPEQKSASELWDEQDD